jgi:hypothetical protein
MLLGSAAEKIVRIAPCPVLTVRGDARVSELLDEQLTKASNVATATA